MSISPLFNNENVSGSFDLQTGNDDDDDTFLSTPHPNVNNNDDVLELDPSFRPVRFVFDEVHGRIVPVYNCGSSIFNSSSIVNLKKKAYNIMRDPKTDPSIPVAGCQPFFTKLPADLIFCITDFLWGNRKDIVNLSATCRQHRMWLYDLLARDDLHSGRLLTLRFGLKTQNIRAIDPFFDFYRELITRVHVARKEDEEAKLLKEKKDAEEAAAAQKDAAAPKQQSIFGNDNGKKKGTAGKKAAAKAARAKKPTSSKPLESIIFFRDESLVSLRQIRLLVAHGLEKALIAHDLTFAERLLWHADKALLPSLTPVLEAVLWTALHSSRVGKPGPLTPIVWTWNTCPVAAVRILVAFGAKGNRAGICPQEKRTRTGRRAANQPDLPPVYDGYYSIKTETSKAHKYMLPMPPGRLWTALERVAFFYGNACGRAAAAESGGHVAPVGASAGSASVAHKRGIKRNLSGSFHKPSSDTGKEHHRFFPVICESHDGKVRGRCFKELVEVLCGSIVDEEVRRATTADKKKPTSKPKTQTHILEDGLELLLKKTETTVSFADMLIDSRAGKLFEEIFEQSGESKFKALGRFAVQEPRANKQMKTEDMASKVPEVQNEEVPNNVSEVNDANMTGMVHEGKDEILMSFPLRNKNKNGVMTSDLPKDKKKEATTSVLPEDSAELDFWADGVWDGDEEDEEDEEDEV